jgi:hypothetical protein
LKHFNLVLSDFYVRAFRLLLDEHAVDASALEAERSSVLRDLRTIIAGIEDLHSSAVPQWLN